MPFIPHTAQDVDEMLQTIGIKDINMLFDEIPSDLQQASLEGVPAGLSEMELSKLMRERAAKDGNLLCFIGAGAYEHHIPAAVWEITTRGEFYTAYTPYQAEASQGSLQVIYEYQTMMANLLAMEVSNASLYDGASALAESVLMTVRLSKKGKSSILMPKTIHPFYREAVQTIVSHQGIHLIDVPYDQASGKISFSQLQAIDLSDAAAFVIPQPNFFGVLEDVDQLTNWAQDHDLLSIALVNPLAMALLTPPGSWGKNGVDIACGEGQSLGIPLASGGPYYGFLCCKKTHVRQMPGRVVGKTVDREGKPGYVLTLQAREQHIRRAKATSNICTNQGLMVTASTIYMSLMGPMGLRQVAARSHEQTRKMRDALQAIGMDVIFSSPYFHEIAFHSPIESSELIQALAREGIQAGFALKPYYPELGDAILLCATETKTDEDIQKLAQALQTILGKKKLKELPRACQG